MRKKTTFKPDEVKEIKRLYLSEMKSINSIGKSFGVYPTIIRKVLIDNNIEIRSATLQRALSVRAKYDLYFETVKRLYFNDMLSIKEVSKKTGVSITIVQRLIHENGLKTRTKSESQRLRFAKKRENINLNEVLCLYFDEKQGIPVIAKKFRVACSYIKRVIEDAGYKTRNQSEANSLARRHRNIVFTEQETDEILRLYTVEKLSTAHISQKFNVSTPIIRRLLQSRNIEIRPSSFYRKTREEKRNYPQLTAPETVQKLDATEINKKKVHELRYVENKSLAEIAKMAGLSTVEVYSILGGK